MSNSVLILKNNNSIFFDDVENVFDYYKKNGYSTLSRIFRKIFIKLNCPLESIFYGSWKKYIYNYDIVILFDSGCTQNIPKYIKRKNKNIKIIFWYWNSLDEHKNNLFSSNYIDEMWSYNRFDCKNYNLKYNPQFYLKKSFVSKKEDATDILFLGKDKGRKQNILNLKEIFEKNNLECNFYIIESSKDYMDYETYLEKLNNSKCVLDYNYSLPCGITLRPLEAMYYEKKLITNNTDIVNYKFYNHNNIFVLGEDNIENLENFIKSPYKKISKDIMDYYSFNSWLSRISNGITTEYKVEGDSE